jgi:hypothetical protein
MVLALFFLFSVSEGSDQVLQGADHGTRQHAEDRSADDPIGDVHVCKIHAVNSLRSGFTTSDHARGQGAGRFESAASMAGCEPFENPATLRSGVGRGYETTSSLTNGAFLGPWAQIQLAVILGANKTHFSFFSRTIVRSVLPFNRIPHVKFVEKDRNRKSPSVCNGLFLRASSGASRVFSMTETLR